MSKVVRHPKGKPRPHNAPWYTLYPRRLSALWDAIRHQWRGFRTKREARRSIVPNRTWLSFRPFSVLVRVIAYLGAAGLALWLSLQIWTSVWGPVGWFSHIQDSSWFGPLVPFLLTAFGVTVFLLVAFRLTKKPILVKATRSPQELVPTAGSVIDEIVGRDELAQVIAQTLRDRRTRRPYLLIGGVGVGKTAVLVELTRMLAQHGAVPVPVRLRDADADGTLDFEAMGRDRFRREANQGVLFSGKVDRTWRQLRLDDKVVVLADGLEEALLDEKHRDDRDNIIRQAIDRADREGLPLVVASRPHAPLEGTAAAVAELEPLSEEAALDYLLEDAREVDERRLDWIVETADVTDSPFYLQIARNLRQAGLLEHLALRQQPGRMDTRTKDTPALRLRLLDTYCEALVDGRLYGDLVLDRAERQKTVHVMAALACLGLFQDSLEVNFDELMRAYQENGREQPVEAAPRRRPSAPPEEQRTGGARLTVTSEQRRAVWRALIKLEGESWLGGVYRPNELRTELGRCARNGQRLGLVSSHENKVRFPHSILQAYLGFRVLSTMADGELAEVVGPALQPPGPARELLIALVLVSRHRSPLPRHKGARIPATLLLGGRRRTENPSRKRRERVHHRHVTDQINRYPAPRREAHWTLAERLCSAAKDRHDAKFFDLYAAALEIDSVGPVSVQPDLAVSLATRWREVTRQIKDDQRTVEEAKLRLVRRFGAALRELEQITAPTGPDSGLASGSWKSSLGGIDELEGGDWLTPAYAYESFAWIGRQEPSRPVRLAIAQEIAAGGDDAYLVVRRHFHEIPDPVGQYLQKINESKQEEDAEFQRAVGGAGRAKCSGARPQDIIDRYERRRVELWREFVMRAWLVPMLVGSVSETYREEAKERLDLWLRHLDPNPSLGKPLPSTAARPNRSPRATWLRLRKAVSASTGSLPATEPLTAPHREPDLPLSLEIALAQGFKYAANRRKRHPNTCEATRCHLVQQAERMLACSRYWYAQVCLLHALSLWELPDSTGHVSRAPHGGHGGRQAPQHDGHLNDSAPAHPTGDGTDDPLQAVSRWLSMVGSAHDAVGAASSTASDTEPRKLHPFVAEAGDLAALALETRRPERFLWIDENGAIDSVGSRPADPDRYRKHNLWIAPSVGWSSLHPRAQQLVADMLIMLNLTERDSASPDELEERLRKADQDILPPCLTRDRTPLQPERSVGRAESDQPGSTCLYECRFRLCPYPPKAGRPQTEIEEPFCRQQQALLHRRSRWRLPAIRRTTPPWAGIPVKALDRFWETMAGRNHRFTDDTRAAPRNVSHY